MVSDATVSMVASACGNARGLARHGGNVLTLKNVALANLHQDDFQFIAA